MFCANTDDTDRIISQRQLSTLTALGKNLVNCLTREEVIEKTISSLEENQHDFPFAMFYLVRGDRAFRAHCTHLGPATDSIPDSIDLGNDDPLTDCLRRAIASRELQLLRDVQKHFGDVPKGAWEVSSDKAVVLPVVQAGSKEPYGILLIGFNPFRLLDEKYSGFFKLIADQIATSFADVHILDEERKRAEALAEIDRAKTTFFSNISHEFRTPLTLLLGPVEDALNDPDTVPENKTRMEMAYRNGLRMQKLVNTLLEFSRIEAGRMEGRFERIDICALTEDLASTFRSAIERAGMKLEFRCSPLTDEVYVDVDMWERIVLNLISNAFKYCKKGTIGVEVKQVGQEVQVAVTDTGVGIPPDHLGKIFDRFHRIDNTEGRSQEGTGIGLAMVRELVKLHQGNINVASQPGKGSTFTVCLPLGKNHLPPDKISETSRGRTAYKHSAAFLEEAMKWVPLEEKRSNTETGEPIPKKDTVNGKPRVLLADDNADMRQYVERLLSDQYSVITAGDGEEAYEKAIAYNPELLLSDIMMPRLDGIGLLKKMRSRPETKNTPVIFLSARAGEEAKVEGLDAGADDYLVKPFSAKELIVRVNNHIRINQVRRETEQQFYHLFMQAPTLINLFRGPDFVFELFHPKNKEILGEVDYTGRPLKEAMPELDGHGVLDILKEVYDTGRTVRHDELRVMLKRDDGQLMEKYFNSTYQPWYDIRGNIQGVVNFAIDITEAVRSKKVIEENEKQFRRVLLNSPSIYLILQGPEMRITFVNEPLLNSWRKTADIIGKTLLEVLPELTDQPFPKLLEKVYTTGEPHYGNEEKAVLYKDGMPREVYYNYVYQAIMEPDKSISGITIMASDITEQVIARKKIEESERKYRQLSEELEMMVEDRTKELKRSNDDLQQFAHVASHDLKEPVRKFRTFINRLSEEYGKQLPAKAQNYLDKMLHASERMSSMITGVLKYSAINESERDISIVDLNEIIRNIETDLEVVIHQKNALIKKEILARIEGAPLLMYQLFYNLVNNSLKFSRERPVIDISSSTISREDKEYTRIVIADNGIGFDQAYAERIFEAFTRLNSKDKYEGTGLGLALCKKIVERHNGTITASGEAGKGAVFTILLPLVQTEKKI